MKTPEGPFKVIDTSRNARLIQGLGRSIAVTDPDGVDGEPEHGCSHQWRDILNSVYAAGIDTERARADRLAEILRKIAYEPIGHATDTWPQVLDAITTLARSAL